MVSLLSQGVMLFFDTSIDPCRKDAAAIASMSVALLEVVSAAIGRALFRWGGLRGWRREALAAHKRERQEEAGRHFGIELARRQLRRQAPPQKGRDSRGGSGGSSVGVVSDVGSEGGGGGGSGRGGGSKSAEFSTTSVLDSAQDDKSDEKTPALVAGVERSDSPRAGHGGAIQGEDGMGTQDEERSSPNSSPPPSPPPAGMRYSITPSRLDGTKAGTKVCHSLSSAEATIDLYVSQLATSPADQTMVGFYVRREGMIDDDASAPLVVATRVAWLGWRHGRARVEVAYDGLRLPYGVAAPIDAAHVRHYPPEAAGRIRFAWGWRLMLAWSFNVTLLLCAWLLVAAHILLVQRGSSERLAACGLSVDAWFHQMGVAFAYGCIVSLVVVDSTKVILATLAAHPRLRPALNSSAARQSKHGSARLSASAYKVFYIMHELLVDVLM